MEYDMSNLKKSDAANGAGLLHMGMIACCAVMLLPIAGFFLAGGTLTGLTSNLSVLGPIVLCIGVHVAMFVVLGKSCHSAKKDEEPQGEADYETIQTSTIPAVRYK